MSQWDLHPKQPRAIHSALMLLEEVAVAGPGVTVRELVGRLDMPRATVYRLVNLLVEDEYLVRLADISGLALGRRVERLMGGGSRSRGVTADAFVLARPPRVTRSLLERLRGDDGVAVHLLRYEDGAPVAFDIDPLQPLSDAATISIDLDRSAAGRLLLAAQSREPSDMAMQSDLLVPGRACIAVPLRDESGELFAALCAAGFSERMDLVLAAAQRNAAAADELAATLT